MAVVEHEADENGHPQPMVEVLEDLGEDDYEYDEEFEVSSGYTHQSSYYSLISELSFSKLMSHRQYSYNVYIVIFVYIRNYVYMYMYRHVRKSHRVCRISNKALTCSGMLVADPAHFVNFLPNYFTCDSLSILL